jgi:hypothetical protein
MEKSLYWNEKCPGDVNRKQKIIEKVENFKWFLGFKKKKTKNNDRPIFDMLLYGY